MTEFLKSSVDKFTTVTAQTLLEIEESVSLVDFEGREIKRHKRLYELAKSNEVDTIKRLVYYPWSEFIDDAEEYLRSEKIVNSKNIKQSTRSYKALNETLSDALKIPVKITNIIFHGYSNTGWSLYFTHNHKRFVLMVPNIQNLNIDNIENENHGKLAIGCTHMDATEILRTSYFIKDFVTIVEDTNN